MNKNIIYSFSNNLAGLTVQHVISVVGCFFTVNARILRMKMGAVNEQISLCQKIRVKKRLVAQSFWKIEFFLERKISIYNVPTTGWLYLSLLPTEKHPVYGCIYICICALPTGPAELSTALSLFLCVFFSLLCRTLAQYWLPICKYESKFQLCFFFISPRIRIVCVCVDAIIQSSSSLDVSIRKIRIMVATISSFFYTFFKGKFSLKFILVLIMKTFTIKLKNYKLHRGFKMPFRH